MPTTPMGELVQRLSRMALLRDGAGPTDGRLLEDFISRGDEAALAALVQRHGPMVWGVCRRVLGSYHDAEDAFQATFLVLARRAASVEPREMVASWLYGVAHRTARKARATAGTRRGRERPLAAMPEPAAEGPAGWEELLPALDEELCRLTDSHRAAVVLCDLEGKTRREAARQLGVPEGTVAGWVARARGALAKRLARRGVTLSAGALAAALARGVASAGAPAFVVSNTIEVARRVAAGQAASGAVPAHVAALSEGVVKAMRVSKLKHAAAFLLLAAALGGGAGLIRPSRAGDEAKARRAEKGRRPDARKAERPRPLAERLQGAWKIVSTVEDGETLKGDAQEVGEWTFKGATIRVKSQPKGLTGGATVSYLRFRLDEKAVTPGIDLVEAKADDLFDTAALDKRLDDDDERKEGLVSLKGDTLTICYSPKKNERPTALESKAGSEYVLIVLERQAPNNKKDE